MKKMHPYLKEFLEILAIIAIAILIRSVLYEPYVVPSTSMLPTTLVGDRIVVQKYSYGISSHSFPFSPPLFKGRIFDIHRPERGDIVVIKTDKVYIKRLIGLPGDTIQMISGRLFINGKQVHQNQIQNFEYEGASLPQFVETLPNGKTYKVLDSDRNSQYDNTQAYKVPEGHYFFMGDNRDNSRDSRDLNGPLGFVPYENIRGRVQRILFSSTEIRWYNPIFLLYLNKDRFFKAIE